MTYGRWTPLEHAAPPEGPGLVQARYDQGAKGLIAFPNGLSAMAWYGADDVRLSDAISRLRALVDPAEHRRIWVRFAAPETGRSPSLTIESSLRAFTTRFGAPPPLNR